MVHISFKDILWFLSIFRFCLGFINEWIDDPFCEDHINYSKTSRQKSTQISQKLMCRSLTFELIKRNDQSAECFKFVSDNSLRISVQFWSIESHAYPIDEKAAKKKRKTLTLDRDLLQPEPIYCNRTSAILFRKFRVWRKIWTFSPQ